MTTCALIRSDYRRYVATGNHHFLSVILSYQGFWASVVYRINHRIVAMRHIPVLSRILKLFVSIDTKIMEIVAGICMAYDAEIGPGILIIHFGNIIIGSKVKMGRNCTVSHGVTIGGDFHGAEWGMPEIGDRVFIGPNAVIVGKLTIGDDVKIGAGAIVSRSIPSKAVVIGNPGRIVWYEGSFNVIKYDGMETDPERIASMAAPHAASKKEQYGTHSVGVGGRADLQR